MVEIERLRADDYLLRSKPVYVDNYGLHSLYERLAFKSNLILVGPKGVGKTLSFVSWCAERKIPLITMDCSEDVRRSHLIGSPFLRNASSSPFVLGPIPTAYEVANEAGQAVLAFEEINALTPQMQKVINAAADFRSRVVVPEAQRIFELRKGAKLWIVGTMNTTVYGGVYSLNEDLKSRFRMVPLKYPETSVLRAIVTEAASELPTPDIIDGVLTLAKEAEKKAMEYQLSPRDVVQILEDTARVGLEKALWLASGKFEDVDRETFMERAHSTFGVRVPS